MRTISFIAFKGGSGKTTLAVNVAAALAGRHTVALIDLDPQGNATSAAPITHEGNTTVAEALLEASKNPRYFLTEESFSHVTFPDGSGFYLLPTPDADELSVAGERVAATPGGEHALARALSRLMVGATVIDTAPSISRLTASAVAASTAVFAPFTADAAGSPRL